jgi:TetR/AcrR family transcriptional repressor of nem operon
MSKAEKTKALIIEKTAPIFNTRGFSGTSLNDITAATGLSKGSIYGNFANKDEVALAVFDYNLSKLIGAIETQLAKETWAKNKLLVYATCYERFMLPPFTKGGCPILNTAVEADDTHPALRKKAASAIISWQAKIVRIIEDGVANKEFCETINAKQFALTMISMIEGAIMVAKLLGDTTSMPTVMQTMKKMIEGLK